LEGKDENRREDVGGGLMGRKRRVDGKEEYNIRYNIIVYV
jgi:hypothetical protein